MKAFALAAACSALACSLAAGAGPTDDSAAIRQRVDDYVTAYNQHDAEALASCWDQDAVYLNRDTGQPVEGRQAIREMFVDLFETGEASQLSVTIDSIRFVTPDVAIEDGSAETVAEGGETVVSTYTAVHVKKDGVWYLNSVRETDAPTSPSAHNELEPLAWLIGEWADEADDATTYSHWQWAKNGHFLVNNFHVHVGDQAALEGTQVVGWDPDAGRIRSWIFDSEGGFGEGVWRRDGDAWIVKTKSTLGGRSHGTATSVYTPMDENSFSWKSVDRRIDGEPQEDIDEIAVRRQSVDPSGEVTQDQPSEGK